MTISSTPVKFRGGGMELNAKLRLDRQASAAIPAGRFYANSKCAADAPAAHECHLTSLLQFSPIPDHSLRHLRRSQYLWIEDGADVSLNFEFVLKNITVFYVENGNVLVEGRNIGTCVPMTTEPLHVLLDPETRQPPEGLSLISPHGARAMNNDFDVSLRTCSEVFQTGSPSETLAPQTSQCSARNVLNLLPTGAPLLPGENPPLCMTALQLPRAKTVDRSYTLTPRPKELFGLEDTAAVPIIGWSLARIRDARFAAIWENATLTPQAVEPHLKVVPLNGMRSIARPMTATALTILPDGSQRSEWEYRVAVEDGQWLENFSPQVIVSRTRIRVGAQSAQNTHYPRIERLKLLYRGAPDTTCQTRTGHYGGNEHDVVLCHDDRLLRANPAYTAGQLATRPVDDGDRLTWNALIVQPPGAPPLTANSPVFIEFDLTALADAGSAAGGPLQFTPAAHHIEGRVPPRGTRVLRGQVFGLRNNGVTGVRIEQVTITGPDAAEFGPVQLHLLPDVPNRLLVLAPAVTPPAAHPAARNYALSLAPEFRSTGTKRAEIVVRYRDVRDRVGEVRAPLTATISL